MQVARYIIKCTTKCSIEGEMHKDETMTNMPTLFLSYLGFLTVTNNF